MSTDITIINKILILIDLPDSVVSQCYKQNRELNSLSYQKQKDFLKNQGITWSGAWTRPFALLNIDTIDCYYNVNLIQKKWAKEKKLPKYISTDQILDEYIKTTKPDAIFIETVRDFGNDWIDKIKKENRSVKKVIGHLCNPWYDTNQLKKYDLIFTCTSSIKNDLEESGIRSVWLANSFNSDITVKDNVIKSAEAKLCFYGSFLTIDSAHITRIDLITYLLENNITLDIFSRGAVLGFSEKLYSLVKFNLEKLFNKKSWRKLFNKILREFLKKDINQIVLPDIIKKNELPAQYGIELYNCLLDYDTILNIHTDMTNEAANMRLFEATGLGVCLLTDDKENLSQLFEIGKEILVYKDFEDCIKKIHWIKENPEKVKEISKAGKARTLADHTYYNRARSILKELE